VNSLIGNTDSAKFIFFALDDLSSSPNEKDIQRLLNTKKVHVYKRNGYYGESLRDIDKFIYLKHTHLLEHQNWTQNGFTHAVRVGSECDLNVTIELAYGHIVVACLHLNFALLKELNEILEDLSDLKSKLSKAENEKNYLISKIQYISELEFMKNQHLIPGEDQIIKIFDAYGLAEMQLMKSRFDDWYQRANWKIPV